MTPRRFPSGIMRMATRWLIVVLYAAAGVLHIIDPAPFLSITPQWVPMRGVVVFWTGVAELLGAAAMAQGFSPRLRRAGAWGLAAYALLVFPANINHFILDMARADSGLGLAYHMPRMVAQPMLIALTFWAGGALPKQNGPAD